MKSEILTLRASIENDTTYTLPQTSVLHVHAGDAFTVSDQEIRKCLLRAPDEPLTVAFFERKST